MTRLDPPAEICGMMRPYVDTYRIAARHIWASARHAEGCSWSDIGAALGISMTTARRAGMTEPAMANRTALPSGEIVPSQAEAARRLGVSRITIHNHLEAHGDLSRVSAGRKPGNRNGLAVVAYGRRWPTQAACARDLGVSETAVHFWMRDGRRDLLKAAIDRRAAQ